MRKIGSCLIILLLLTAYGRCMADQFGMLHTTTTSCCQTTCDELDHCVSPKNTDDTQPGSPEHPDNEEEPSPCHLCLILSNDSMLLEDGVKIPSPTLLDVAPLFTFSITSHEFLGARPNRFSLEPLGPEPPKPPTEQSARLRRIVAKTTPVRGPSIA